MRALEGEPAHAIGYRLGLPGFAQVRRYSSLFEAGCATKPPVPFAPRSPRRQTLNASRSTLLAIAFGILAVACGGTIAHAPAATPIPTPSPTPSPVDISKMKISIDSTFIRSVKVGSSTDFDLDIQDVGTDDIPYLTLLFDTGDRCLDTYTISSAGPCKLDAGIAGLACGKLAVGTHLKFTISATPRTAGSYIFKFHVSDYKQILEEADGNQYVYSWTQTVTS
jgi:hypothetical protein